jgi:hypothetical protein
MVAQSRADRPRGEAGGAAQEEQVMSQADKKLVEGWKLELAREKLLMPRIPLDKVRAAGALFRRLRRLGR